MLARIAAYTEAHRPARPGLQMANAGPRPTTAATAIASVVEHALETVPCAAVFVPTRSGTTARMISRFSRWLGGRIEPRRGSLSGSGLFLRRASGALRGGSGELARFCGELAPGTRCAGHRCDAGSGSLEA